MCANRPLLVLALGASCTVGGGEAGPAERDSTVVHQGASVALRIVENPSNPVAALPRRVVADSPSLDLGGPDAPPEASLFRVRGAIRLSDGRIAVADGGSASLKIFDPAGGLAGTIGREGSGPGEFREPRFLARLPGDSLLVFDIGLGRLTVFGPDGEIAREARIGAAPRSPASSVMGVFGDGSVLARGFIDLGDRVPIGLERPVSALYRLSADGTLLDSLGSVVGGQSYFFPFDDGGFSVYTPPFARTSEVFATADRVVLGDSDRPEIRILTPTGRPSLWIRWPDDARSVDAAAIAQAREYQLGETRGETQQRRIHEMFRDMPMPSRMPSFARVRAAQNGEIWVETYRPPWESAAADWRIFEPGGRLIARITLPGRFTPSDIGDGYVLGIWRDALDVERVRLYEVRDGGR